MNTVQPLGEATFKPAVQDSQGVKILKFGADWCGPCKAMKPVLEGAAEDNPDIDFFDIDVDVETFLAREHDVMSIPVIVGYRDGEKVATMTGAASRGELDYFIQKVSMA